MSQPVDSPRRVAGLGALVAVAAGLAGAVWWSGTLAAPEKLLARSYQAAIAEAEVGASDNARLMPAAMTDAEPRRVDAIWPGTSDSHRLAFHRPLKVGDRITISSRAGKPDRLAIVELQEVDGSGIGAPGVRFQLVTSRQEGAPEGTLVRFLIAVDGGTVAPASNKTL